MAQVATRTGKLQAAHMRLTEAVESIVSGDDWKRMLQVFSKFHRYSFNNHQVEPPSNGPRLGSACVLGRRVGLRPKSQERKPRSIAPFAA